ncbi:MAG: DUF4198 domain-containing protein [Cyclobacteriaceae bacterium]|nr:DUF4198 domain-containing protein [Cyclobacteriaceae bacterium]
MNRKCALALFSTLFIASLLQAHEFWMQPHKFKFSIGEMAQINFMVGENFVGERWNLNKHRLLRLDHHHASSTEGLIEQVNSGEGNNLEVKLMKEGTHLFVMQSNNAFIELEGEKFNAYLEEDGIEDVLAYRKKNNLLDKPAKEYYARCAKLLLQAGSRADDTYKKRVGLPLEIVPVNNPYTAKKGDEISFQVFYEGKPLPFTMVKVWNRMDGTTFAQNIYTMKDGTITTRLSNTGAWMVSCVRMVPAKEEGADWQSYWASLVFGF